MHDGWRVRSAGPLRGLCCPVRGRRARVPETRGGLRDTGTVFLGHAGDVVPGWPCLLRTGGQEAWRRLGSRKSVCRRPLRGARGRLCRRLPVFLVLALALAWGFVSRDMRGAGVGSRAGLPLRSAPRVRRIISLASSCVWAGGSASAPVVGVPLPLAFSGGGAGRVTAGAVIPPEGGMVSAPCGGGLVSGGTLLGPALIVPLRGAVRLAVCRAASPAGALTAVASVVAVWVPLGGSGSAVGRSRGPARRLRRRRGTVVLPGYRLTHRSRQQRWCLLADHVGGKALWRRGSALRGPLRRRRVCGAAV